jgi:hypothetical protein
MSAFRFSQARCRQAIADSLLLAAAAHLRYCREFDDCGPSPNRSSRQRDWRARALALGSKFAKAFHLRR